MDNMNDHELHRQIDREVSDQGGLLALLACVVAVTGILIIGAFVLYRQFA